MAKNLILSLMFSLFLNGVTSASVVSLNYVKIGIIEALELGNSTSSERYRSAFEAALYYAIGENEKKLNSCGYRLQVEKGYFSKDDALGAEKSAIDMEKKGVWIVLGPRRSEDFLKTLVGLKRTVVVSPMANSNRVLDQPSPSFTMYPPMVAMSNAALSEIVNRKYGKNYATLVDATCPSCRDFEESFDEGAIKFDLKKMFSIDLTKDLHEIAPVLERIRLNTPDFIVIPNTSKLSGFLISKISEVFPNIKFVGDAGWGDDHYGYLSSYGIKDQVNGFCVRLGNHYEKMKQTHFVHSLDYDWKGELVGPNYTAYAAIEWVRRLSSDLCKIHPVSKGDFYKKMAQKKGSHFRMKDRIGVLELHRGKLRFTDRSYVAK